MLTSITAAQLLLCQMCRRSLNPSSEPQSLQDFPHVALLGCNWPCAASSFPSAWTGSFSKAPGLSACTAFQVSVLAMGAVSRQWHCHSFNGLLLPETSHIFSLHYNYLALKYSWVDATFFSITEVFNFWGSVIWDFSRGANQKIRLHPEIT